MTAGFCGTLCHALFNQLFGVVNGQNCRECSSHRYLRGRGFWFRDLVVLITPFGCQVVETSRLPEQRPFLPRFAISNALAILLRTVVARILLLSTGVLVNLLLPLFKTWARGLFLDASSKHITVLFCSEVGP